jgi:hypothetical protein
MRQPVRHPRLGGLNFILTRSWSRSSITIDARHRAPNQRRLVRRWEHGNAWEAESKMSMADRVAPLKGSLWDRYAFPNPTSDRRRQHRLPGIAMLPSRKPFMRPGAATCLPDLGLGF